MDKYSYKTFPLQPHISIISLTYVYNNTITQYCMIVILGTVANGWGNTN